MGIMSVGIMFFHHRNSNFLLKRRFHHLGNPNEAAADFDAAEHPVR